MDIPNNIDEITRKLAKILRVQDWDINVHVISGMEMHEKYGDCTYQGLADRNVKLNTADIYINKDKTEEWYRTLVHELLHIQSTPVIHCAKAYFQSEYEYFDQLYEQLTEKQAQIFCSIYPLEKILEEINE